jgi:histidyl-tRNA synthetase
MTSMTALSFQPYKGTRDYYPADKRVQNYIFGVWHRVCRLHGYEEYGTPLLEPFEVYAAKTGQEIVSEQTYTFTDRGDRQVVIRPEMTPSVSRMVAAKRQEMAYPARLYSIANYMRYERPQRGREREFWQLNADVFGVDGVLADAEIITLSYQIMKAFGATDKMFTIRISNRKLINDMMTHYLGLDAVQSQLMIKLFDRKDKLEPAEFDRQATEIFGVEQAKYGLQKILTLASVKSVAALPEELKENSAVKELEKLFMLLDEAGVKNAAFDITLMRGFDYYTGMVFEFFDNHPDNNRAMFGGGRYDGLVGLFGVDPIATVGVAPGLTPMELFLESHSLMPELPSTTEVGIIVLGSALDGALKFASRLRDEGVNVEVDITDRKLDKQIKSVVKKQIPFMVFVGDDELVNEQYPFKDTKTTEEEKLSFERIVSKVKDRRLKTGDEFELYFD